MGYAVNEQEVPPEASMQSRPVCGLNSNTAPLLTVSEFIVVPLGPVVSTTRAPIEHPDNRQAEPLL